MSDAQATGPQQRLCETCGAPASYGWRQGPTYPWWCRWHTPKDWWRHVTPRPAWVEELGA